MSLFCQPTMKRRTFLSSSFGLSGALSPVLFGQFGCNPAPTGPSSAQRPAGSEPREVAPHGTLASPAVPTPVEPEPTPAPARPKIYLQPLGATFSEQDTDFIVNVLGVYFPHPIQALDPLELPQDAYYPPRSRYRAEKLLTFLEKMTPADAQVVVGLTAVDISTTKGAYEDWGILGLAMIGGKQCVISRFRAARGAKDANHTRVRLAKTVIHEVGHTLGLDHCPNYGCIMEDGKGSVTTTDHEYDICGTCRGRVSDSIKVTSPESLPWPRPS